MHVFGDVKKDSTHNCLPGPSWPLAHCLHIYSTDWRTVKLLLQLLHPFNTVNFVEMIWVSHCTKTPFGSSFSTYCRREFLEYGEMGLCMGQSSFLWPNNKINQNNMLLMVFPVLTILSLLLLLSVSLLQLLLLTWSGWARLDLRHRWTDFCWAERLLSGRSLFCCDERCAICYRNYLLLLIYCSWNQLNLNMSNSVSSERDALPKPKHEKDAFEKRWKKKCVWLELLLHCLNCWMVSVKIVDRSWVYFVDIYVPESWFTCIMIPCWSSANKCWWMIERWKVTDDCCCRWLLWLVTASVSCSSCMPRTLLTSPHL